MSDSEIKTYNENNKDLTEKFGSKKRKRILKTKEDNVIEASQVFGSKGLSSLLQQEVIFLEFCSQRIY